MTNEMTFWQRVKWLFGANVRQYKAAQNHRLHQGWSSQTQAANRRTRDSLTALITRSRELDRDNPLGKNYFRSVRNNIVGPTGFTLQVRAKLPRGKQNAALNTQVEDLFKEWSKRQYCSASQKLTFWQQCRLLITQASKDGACLIQTVKTNSKFGFALKIISVDYLDPLYNETRPDGHRVIMSIEVDSDWRPVAYWLTTPASNIMFAERQERRRVRVPAEEIIHAFDCLDDEEQVHGIPWTHAAIMDAHDAGRLDEAVITKATNAAMTLGMIKQTVPDEGSTGFEGDDPESEEIKINRENGTFTLLEPGMEVDKFESDQPTQNYAEYKKGKQSDIAAGLGMANYSLTGDFSQTNFSSGRLGLSVERDEWQSLQTWFAEAVLSRIYNRFVYSCWLNGLLNISPRDFDEIHNHVWQSRGWEYIQPLQDAQADALAVGKGFTTMRQVWNKRGYDYDQQLEDMVEERAEFEAKGLPYPEDPDATPEPPADEPDPKPSDKKKDKAAKV